MTSTNIENIDNMLKKIDNLKLSKQYDNPNIHKYYDKHIFLYEIGLNISNFFSKKGGGINTILKDNINAFSKSFMNEIDKIRNGQAYLIKNIYQNTIFSNLNDYTLNDQIRFTIFLLKDLKIKYLINTGKVYVFGGKNKKGGGIELVIISGIIIGAIWSLINIYEKLDEWMKQRNGNSKSSPFMNRNYEEYTDIRLRPTSEMIKMKQEEYKKKKRPSPKREKTPSPKRGKTPSPKREKTISSNKKKKGLFRRMLAKFPII
jgi:hypothetical protein